MESIYRSTTDAAGAAAYDQIIRLASLLDWTLTRETQAKLARSLREAAKEEQEDGVFAHRVLIAFAEALEVEASKN